MDTGEDRTVNFSPREELLSKVINPFIPTSASFLLNDYHYESQAEFGAILTKKNPRKGRSGPLADVVCLFNVRLIAAVALCQREKIL